MYYYGNNGYFSGGYAQNSMPCYGGNSSGYGVGAAIWIVLFILLVIILGAGWSFNNSNN